MHVYRNAVIGKRRLTVRTNNAEFEKGHQARVGDLVIKISSKCVTCFCSEWRLMILE